MREVFRAGVIAEPTRWDAAATRSQEVVTLVEVLRDRTPIGVVDTLAGSVTVDRHALVRSRLQITAVGSAPFSAVNPLTPYGYELRVWLGFAYGDGVVDVVPVGTFPIQRSQIDGLAETVTIDAMDRMQILSDARFEDVTQIAAGTNYATAITQLIDDSAAGLQVLLPATTHTTPLLTFTPDDDRGAAVQAMASSVGWELYPDGLGRLVARPDETESLIPAATVAEGETLTSIALVLDRGPAYNRVIAVSSNASLGAVYRGVATDNDPTSPTYYDGPFGHKPRFYASPFIASTAQAEAAAAAVLASNRGVGRELSFGMAPNPRIEPGDAVLVQRSLLGVNEIQVIDSLTVGLGPAGTMTCRTRAISADLDTGA